jgi:hypothetical protein
MDYLIIEGYPTAAQKFATEANIQPKISTEALEARVSIRQAILSGNIERAIERVNDFNPEVRLLSVPYLFAMIIRVTCTTHSLGFDEHTLHTSVLRMSNSSFFHTSSTTRSGSLAANQA